MGASAVTMVFGYRASLVLRDDAGRGIEITDGFLESTAVDGPKMVNAKLVLSCIKDWQQTSEPLPYRVLPKPKEGFETL